MGLNRRSNSFPTGIWGFRLGWNTWIFTFTFRSDSGFMFFNFFMTSNSFFIWMSLYCSSTFMSKTCPIFCETWPHPFHHLFATKSSALWSSLKLCCRLWNWSSLWSITQTFWLQLGYNFKEDKMGQQLFQAFHRSLAAANPWWICLEFRCKDCCWFLKSRFWNLSRSKNRIRKVRTDFFWNFSENVFWRSSLYRWSFLSFWQWSCR